ncbi:hypothetical protein CDAR_519541 [Caerostris darwini]|uniref:Uncharacterized protein n=1 Tax=Caerostris darwini TaxID=1538125 RepID=A0AAV4TT21_9ARAC|nr:hypothetical protein CDAR_519541 [Caerostris darwini]
MSIYPHTSEVPSSLHLACEVIQKMQTGDLFEDVPYLSFRSAEDGDEDLEKSEDHTCSTLLKLFAVTCRYRPRTSASRGGTFPLRRRRLPITRK